MEDSLSFPSSYPIKNSTSCYCIDGITIVETCRSLCCHNLLSQSWVIFVCPSCCNRFFKAQQCSQLLKTTCSCYCRRVLGNIPSPVHSWPLFLLPMKLGCFLVGDYNSSWKTKLAQHIIYCYEKIFWALNFNKQTVVTLLVQNAKKINNVSLPWNYGNKNPQIYLALQTCLW